MIERLYISGMFVHQDVTFTFDRGLTSITGQNESGKSLIVEAIRYALFGSSALRGQATDYGELHVELDFTIKDRKFEVVRKKNKVTLTEKGDPGDQAQEVTGTKPVNEAIIRLLGYDLLVFDVANVCNQGQVEALSNMRPAERKTMVDRTIGLDVLDKVIEYCGAESNAKRKAAGEFLKGIVKPVEPKKPDTYQESFKVKETVDRLEKLNEEYFELKGLLSQVPEKPVKPKACPVKLTTATLRGKVKDRDQVIQGIETKRLELRRIKLPVMTKEQIEETEKAWSRYELWQEKKDLLDKGENQCPECGHTWPYEAERLKAYEDIAEVEKPSVPLSEVGAEKHLLPNLAIADQLKSEIENLQGLLNEMPDLADDLAVRTRYELEVSNYEARLEIWKEYNKDLEKKQKRFEELEQVPGELALARSIYTLSEQYEREKTTFDRLQLAYEQNITHHAGMIAQSDDFALARKNIQALKIEVKTYLLPSLNKVASLLLNQMTGGERSHVDIDENFEILIDGQRVNTLSGSGKAVANLAIRIALGQILTNRVFSIFMADEVDAAMDDDRATYTAEALQRLTDTVSQVVLVTHKKPSADHEIELRR